ncbi:MarR family transcriptional regulator [Actinoplanes sp. SE50]|uniref:MarR family winged helix-turn-helix transcriptional regulator n=1 Tax=unclassified Actinoplanes TaxID=2626549 RepID=UPI00023EE0BA|nr:MULTISPECIES: MarR family transcriptional regulator [unclassified Actinoplanes]AEV88475.1 MarR family transcriptional regulator [Actinoplanes sp. SE50/110]ATO86880.1 MarR family transcriptional regulator [Actinoplanes sp. SE50]SLM04298.1 MarR family transcriptional regulator [Actinoplanes sp. SE50/110]
MEPENDLVERWRSLLTCYNEVALHLERALQDAHGLTLSDYETLDRLTTQECDKRRMQDLADTMYLSQSALSRAVSRLVNGGLAERTHCEADRRGVYVQITASGRQRWAEAQKTQLSVLAEHLTPAG